MTDLIVVRYPRPPALRPWQTYRLCCPITGRLRLEIVTDPGRPDAALYALLDRLQNRYRLPHWPTVASNVRTGHVEVYAASGALWGVLAPYPEEE